VAVSVTDGATVEVAVDVAVTVGAWVDVEISVDVAAEVGVWVGVGGVTSTGSVVVTVGVGA